MGLRLFENKLFGDTTHHRSGNRFHAGGIRHHDLKFLVKPVQNSRGKMNEEDGEEPKASTSKEAVILPSVHTKADGNSILVNPRQRGNPLLKSITNVPWEYDDRIIPDYVMGPTTCALFLSVRYHNLNPDYIHDRLKALGKHYLLRVLLVLVDVKEPQHALKTLTRISILTDLTLLICRNSEDAGKIVERYKIYQNKPPDLIMEKKEADPHLRLVSALTSVRSINKTDATILLSTFGSFAKILSASESSLSLCPGIGPQKAARLYKVLHQPFLKNASPPAKQKKNV